MTKWNNREVGFTAVNLFTLVRFRRLYSMAIDLSLLAYRRLALAVPHVTIQDVALCNARQGISGYQATLSMHIVYIATTSTPRFMRLIFLTFASILSFSVCAQRDNSDLQMEKKFDGPRFYSGGHVLKPKEVLPYMANNDEAYSAFKKAKSNHDAAGVFGFIGGAMIGYPLGTAIAGGNPEWGLAAGGVGFVLLSLPFSHAFSKHAIHAFDLYSQSNAQTILKPKLYVGHIRGSSLGIIVKF